MFNVQYAFDHLHVTNQNLTCAGLNSLVVFIVLCKGLETPLISIYIAGKKMQIQYKQS